jgi:glycine hydroxymethyltransferase
MAAENYVSPAVMEALSSVFTNKYAEGFPGKRYYGGQEFTDQVESLAIERAKKLFHCDHANVQPLSGAAANIATYFAWLDPGDIVLGMDLGHGGHLTHGAPVTYMGKIFNFIRYKTIPETGAINFAEVKKMAHEFKPKIILAGFSAYPRDLDYAKFKEIADEVGAVAMADVAHIAGLIAGGALKNPFDYGFNVVTTTTHKTLRGPRGAMIMSKGVVGNPLKAPEKTIENLPTLIDRSVFPGFQGGPHMHQVASIAVALYEAAKPEFKIYAQQVIKNAKVLADEMLKYGWKLVTGGTDNHIVLCDAIASVNLSGKQVQEILDKVNITTNKNAIPNDERRPFDPSGVRFGTPAVTTRGMKEEDMKKVANWINEAIEARSDEAKLKKIKEEVKEFCLGFPVPGIERITRNT